jgi:hypothetical protein
VLESKESFSNQTGRWGRHYLEAEIVRTNAAEWVRSALFTHSTHKGPTLVFLDYYSSMALLLTVFLCSGNDSVLCNVHARLDVAAGKKRRYLERAVDTVMHRDKNVRECAKDILRRFSVQPSLASFFQRLISS